MSYYMIDIENNILILKQKAEKGNSFKPIPSL